MVLRPLVRTLAFRVIDLFCNVASVICCMFLRRLGKNLLLQLSNIPKFRLLEKGLSLHVTSSALRSNLYFAGMNIYVESNLL